MGLLNHKKHLGQLMWKRLQERPLVVHGKEQNPEILQDLKTVEQIGNTQTHTLQQKLRHQAPKL